MWQELKYNLKLIGTFITGKMAIAGGVFLAANTGNIQSSFLPFIGVPLGAGLMAYLTKMTYDHDNQQLTDFYRDEIAGKKKMHALGITTKEMEEVGKTNPVMSEMLKRNSNKKLVSLLTNAVGALTAVSLAFFFPAVFTGSIVAALSLSAVSFVVGNAAEMAGEKIFNLNTPTTHDRIQHLGRVKQQQGGKVTQAQVMEVFVHAKHSLGRDIKVRFGKSFDDLSDTQLRMAIEEFGPRINLAQVTADLNNNQTRITSLAFVVANQEPGVKRLAEPPLSAGDKARLAAGKALENAKTKAAETMAWGKSTASAAIEKMRHTFSRVDNVSVANAGKTPKAVQLAQQLMEPVRLTTVGNGSFVEREMERRNADAFISR